MKQRWINAKPPSASESLFERRAVPPDARPAVLLIDDSQGKALVWAWDKHRGIELNLGTDILDLCDKLYRHHLMINSKHTAGGVKYTQKMKAFRKAIGTYVP